MMESRAERILALVVDLITNDWEQVSQLMIDLGSFYPDLKITRDEVEAALEESISRGWAHRDEPQSGFAPEFEELNRYYFKITPLGLTQIAKFPDEWFNEATGIT
jgi:hypothetical protein